MALCIAAGGVVTVLALQTFTLAWTHSIEKVRWEEDYRIEAGALRLTEARIHGSGAGMEPPAGAQLEHGVWRYTPALPPLPVLRLTQSPYAVGYWLCDDGRCAPLLQGPAAHRIGVVELSACDLPASARR
jgi:hypothetical protein